MSIKTVDVARRDAGGATGRGRIPHRKLILALAAVVVLAVAGVWVVAFSPVFGAKNIEIRGTQTLSAGQVRAAAAIESGTPLVRLDTAAVTHRVEQLPDIASASVQTSFPSTVVITVVERKPVGYVKVGGQYRLVDTTGDQYRTVTREPKTLPLLVVPAGTDARTTGGAVAEVAAALPRALLKKIASIQALDPDAITLLLTDHRVVRWGSAARSADKARILPTLLAQKGTQFDVSDPDQPFAR